MFGIIQEVIFPLLCHADSDEELWESDPLEYIRVTYGKQCLLSSLLLIWVEIEFQLVSFSDSYEDLLSHKTAAQNLLHSACQKRKQILPKTVQFLMQGLQTPDTDPKHKDGALCMVIDSVHLLSYVAVSFLRNAYKFLDWCRCRYIIQERII